MLGLLTIKEEDVSKHTVVEGSAMVVGREMGSTASTLVCIGASSVCFMMSD